MIRSSLKGSVLDKCPVSYSETGDFDYFWITITVGGSVIVIEKGKLNKTLATAALVFCHGENIILFRKLSIYLAENATSLWVPQLENLYSEGKDIGIKSPHAIIACARFLYGNKKYRSIGNCPNKERLVKMLCSGEIPDFAPELLSDQNLV